MHPPDAELDTTWFDDEGDLTELDSSDESDQEAPPPAVPRPETNALPAISPPLKRTKETRATTQRATEKSRVRGGLKNTVPCLKPPRTTNYSASSLFGTAFFSFRLCARSQIVCQTGFRINS